MSSQVGLKDLHYAILKKDDATGVEYDKPVRIVGAITAKVKPITNTETQYADDGPADVTTAFGEVSVELNVSDLPLDAQSILFGHKLINGMIVKNSDDIPPFVALGFRSMKANGKYRYFWLYKGKLGFRFLLDGPGALDAIVSANSLAAALTARFPIFSVEIPSE